MYEVKDNALMCVITTIIPAITSDIDLYARALLIDSLIRSKSVTEGIMYIRNATDNQVFESLLRIDLLEYRIGCKVKLTTVRDHLITKLELYLAQQLTDIYYNGYKRI